MPYPTQEQILRGDFKHRPEVIRAAKRWKNLNWKQEIRAGGSRRRAIVDLLHMISGIYGKPVLVEVFPDAECSSAYFGERKTIVLNGTPSIITALHELSHHLFGASELQACRWSVILFKKVFPVAFSRLVWEGHMLVTPAQEGEEDA
jgi:hypothetical protein